MREAVRSGTRPFCAAFAMPLENAIRALAESSLFLVTKAFRTRFSSVRTMAIVRPLIMLRRTDPRARFNADLWFANLEPPVFNHVINGKDQGKYHNLPEEHK